MAKAFSDTISVGSGTSGRGASGGTFSKSISVSVGPGKAAMLPFSTTIGIGASKKEKFAEKFAQAWWQDGDLVRQVMLILGTSFSGAQSVLMAMNSGQRPSYKSGGILVFYPDDKVEKVREYVAQHISSKPQETEEKQPSGGTRGGATSAAPRRRRVAH